MSEPDPSPEWRRSPTVAFVDDGQRVVALDLGDPSAGRPHLLEGSAVRVWRALERGGCKETIASDLAHGAPDHMEATAELINFLDLLRHEGLCGPTS